MNYVLQERLRELRSIHKLSQTEVASRLGISTSAYGYYEQGKNTPSPETLIALSSMFNVSVDYLIGNSNVMNYKEEPEEIVVLARGAKKLTKEQLDIINDIINQFNADNEG